MRAREITLRNRALRLLSRREYSRDELSRKLAPHAQAPEALALLLDELEARDFLSDERYAQARVAARAGCYGNFRLKEELRLNGVGHEIIDDTLAASGDETERAAEILRRKFGDALPAARDERARIARFLARRGFSGETVRQAMNRDFGRQAAT